METKISKLRAMAEGGDWQGALRLAATFADLGDHRSEILRAHQAHANARFYAGLGQDPAALIAAGVEALIERYALTSNPINGDHPMTTTTAFSAVDVAKLTAVILGDREHKRANSKEAAIKRYLEVAGDHGVEDPARYLGPDFDFKAAEHCLFELRKGGFKKGAQGSIAEVESKSPKSPVVDMASARATAGNRAAGKMSQIAALKGEPADAAPKGWAAKPAATPKAEGGKRAAAKAEAETKAAAGELPAVPDFSARTHAGWRKRLESLVAMVEASDIKALEADSTEPKSSSRNILCRYCDLAIVALKAKATKSRKHAT